MNAFSRRSALIGAASLILMAACANPDGTKMTTRQILQSAVRVAKGAVSFAKILVAGFDSNCVRNPSSSLCTNAVILAVLAIGRPALVVIDDALIAAAAAIKDDTSTEERLGNALGNLLASQDDVQKLIDALADKKTAQRYRDDYEAVRQQAQRIWPDNDGIARWVEG